MAVRERSSQLVPCPTTQFCMTDLDLAILDGLEDQELAPLNWGLVDSGFGEDELLDLLDSLADEIDDPRSAEQIRASLLERALLTEVRLPTGSVWRTRMAESVRLLVRLRQLFPPSASPADLAVEKWRTAPTLVSDYRFVARPRRFPARTLSVDEYLGHGLQGTEDAQLAGALRALTDPSAGASSFSAFQARSACAILAGVDSREPSATLISAGTGSGKTKAFYLPALAKLAAVADGKPWTKLIAVYPRTELLKDQLQKALSELRVLKSLTGVRLTLGTMYGDTPLYADTEPRYWPERDGKRICPFLSCPSCGADLQWFLHRNVGALRCSVCDDEVLQDELLISRRQQQDTPPDVLLTTTETLNRQLSNDYTRHVFGVGRRPEHRPLFLLLDEVHTFTGPSGAQAALLLRRWRHAVGQSVHTVGLSATIVDGMAFLGDLAGIAPSNVTVVEPTLEELVDAGKEYLIALRGDPASGTALLSTTIQASMLLRRVLDRADHPISNDAFGSKLFVFTDDLDVTNRLLHFLRNAEGQTDRGKPDPARHPDGSLANLRHPSKPSYSDRLLDGQAWDLCKGIGHDLTVAHNLRIERTSSQDPGLERASDIVVATASLEVGLDDDSVGAVLQHKAPRDAAAFVQRRGRAGRNPSMRPWTAVVLSDYGRDRLAFQAWDTLFDPTLEAVRLPVRNRHVLRIQATYALLDWLAERLRQGRSGSGYVWQDVGGPNPKYEGRRRRIRIELVRLLEEDGARRDLSVFLRGALDVGGEEVERLLWDPPRAVLASVVPTLLRRIDSGWARHASGGGNEDLHTRDPLPDFLPSALFADLLLPEVEIVDPEERAGAGDPVYLGVQQALREFSPGRVTHRFAVGHTFERQWVDSLDGQVPIHEYVEGDPLITMRCSDGIERRVVRPWRIKPSNPPQEIKDSSNTRPVWESSFSGVGEKVDRVPPQFGGWSTLVPRMSFRIHQTGGHLVVHRAAIGSEGTVKRGRVSEHVETRLVDEEGPAALGFRVDVDAFQFEVDDPDDWRETFERDPGRAQTLRSDWFRECIRRHPSLSVNASTFMRDWLSEMALALVAEQGTAGGSLEAGVRALEALDLPAQLDRVLTVVFQSVDPSTVNSSDQSDDDVSVTKLHQELMDLAATPGARDALKDAGRELLDPSWDALGPWLRDRYLSTVAGAVANAAALLHEEISLDEIVVDRMPWEDGRSVLIFSERRPGGVGVIETFFDQYHEDPRRFWRLVEAMIGPAEGEVLSLSLGRIVELAATDEGTIERFEGLRDAGSLSERKTNWRRLAAHLEKSGVMLSPSVRIALSTRLLRPGSTTKTDELLHRLLQTWSTSEAHLGIELDPRVFAHLVSDDPALDESLSIRNAAGSQDRRWRFNAIVSLLWPRGGPLRSRYLELWQSFADLPLPERTLLAERVQSTERTVQLQDLARDASAVGDQLTDHGSIGVVGGARSPELKRAVLRSLVDPVEVGVLELHPRVVGIRRLENDFVVRLEIPEVYG